MLTPGATFNASFDTTNPVAWGFDLGGWIYRDNTNNPVYNTNTLGSATPVVRYVTTPDEKYGYETRGEVLTARPAVVDVPYGSGRSVLIGFNPFYRSWKEQDERLVLNAALYPKGATIGAPAPSPASVSRPRRRRRSRPSRPRSRRPTCRRRRAPRCARRRRPTRGDVRITVKRTDSAKLKAAVKGARLNKSIAKKLSYSSTKTTVTLVIKGVRTNDEHARKTWVSNITQGLDRRKVKVVAALV